MCLYPIVKNYKIENGKRVIDWKSSGVPKLGSPVVKLPCGKCVECLKQRSAEWAGRCVLEASKHIDNCILTLTYSVEPSELIKRDYQMFLKRLRKSIDRPIKYFLCGEYGSLRGRPHFHCIVFGWKPLDMVQVSKDGTDTILYKSDFIERLWGHGFISVGDVNFKSCLYTAKYMQKQNSEHCKGLNIQPPFVAMSKGIALDFADVDYDVDRIYLCGKSYRVPRYFDKINEKNGLDLSEVKERRHQRTFDIVYGTHSDTLEQYNEFYRNLEAHRIIEERLDF